MGPTQSPSLAPSDSPKQSPTPAPSAPIGITCAIEFEKSKGCGAKGNSVRDECCDGLVCHNETQKCRLPDAVNTSVKDKRRRRPDMIYDEIISSTFTESPTFADY